MSSLSELETAFLATPDGPGLIKLYQALQEDLQDDRLAAILQQVRPIQHRITLIQADVEPVLLEALSRDPHKDVRQVVATHNRISEEVCFRLCDDQQQVVRLALRKNPHCHPLIRAALLAEEKRRRPIFELLTEIAWLGRRCEFDAAKVAKTIHDWTQLGEENLVDITPEQAQLMVKVFSAHLGEGTMPPKPRKRRKKS